MGVVTTTLLAIAGVGLTATAIRESRMQAKSRKGQTEQQLRETKAAEERGVKRAKETEAKALQKQTILEETAKETAAEKTEALRKRRRISGTIKTGPRGILEEAPTEKKTLLGQ